MTITRTGKPGRMVIVGCMLRFRRTTCCPAWFRLSVLPRLSAVRMALSLLAAQFRPDAEQRRQRRRREQASPMMVDLIRQAGECLCIGAGLALQHD